MSLVLFEIRIFCGYSGRGLNGDDYVYREALVNVTYLSLIQFETTRVSVVMAKQELENREG